MSREELNRLRRECLRLSRRLAEERTDAEALRQAVGATLGSITFRTAATANRWASRLLGMQRGPTAWDQLPALLEDSAQRRRAGTAPGLAGPDITHAEATTNAAGLVRLDESPDAAVLLVTGAACPLELTVKHQRFENEGEVPADLDCWGVLAIPESAEDLKTLERAENAALAFGCPLAVLSDAPALVARADVGLSAGGNSPEQDSLFVHRQLCTLRSYARAGNKTPFTESAYLRSNQDIREALEAGEFASAREHWDLIGRQEFLAGSRGCALRADEPSLGLRKVDAELTRKAAEEIASWPSPPRISVIVPVYKVARAWLEACVESVKAQLYPHWQLCLVDDASGQEDLTDYLESLSDDRIVVRQLEENQGISGASNEALTLANGDYVALLDHDDELTLDALWLMARAIVHHQPDILYSDEAKLDSENRVVEPHFKPDFSWPMLLSQNYVSHLGVYRRDLVTAVGGFRKGFEGSQDHDLLLRVARKARSVFHISRILYYWRKVEGSTAQRFSDKDYAWDRGLEAVREAARSNAVKGPFPGTYRVCPEPSSKPSAQPSVTILIPFRDQPELLEGCLRSITDHTDYGNYRVLGINNQSQHKQTQRLMQTWASHERVRFMDFDQPFNFSAINNAAVAQAQSDFVLLLNNDIEVMEAQWLQALLDSATQPGVGAVGGRLLYPDRTLQHAGVILGIGGVAGHSHKYLPADHHGYFCRPHLIQNVSAVTGACLLVARNLYLAAGGLDEENLTVAFNDIDFCLRLREMGYAQVYTPACTLIHHESKSRGAEDTPEKQRRFHREASYMRQRHGLTLCLGDACYNPNLTLVTEDFALRADVQQLVVQQP